MTFEEWQATKKLVSVGDEPLEDHLVADDTEKCWIYEGGLIIECRPGDRYLLQLPMESEEGEEIEPLERRLYEFGVEEGSIPQTDA